MVWADFNPADDQYFGRPYWTPDGETLLVQWMNRRQNVLKLYALSPCNGKGHVIYKEEQETWLNWIDNILFYRKDF